MLVVFPGHLDHEVPTTKGRRICASGNFHLKPIDIYAEQPDDKFKDEGFQRKVSAKKQDDFYQRQNRPIDKPLGFKS